MDARVRQTQKATQDAAVGHDWVSVEQGKEVANCLEANRFALSQHFISVLPRLS